MEDEDGISLMQKSTGVNRSHNTSKSRQVGLHSEAVWIACLELKACMVPGPMRDLRLSRSGAARRYGLWHSAIGDFSRRKVVTSLSLDQKDEQETVLPAHEQAQGYQEVGDFPYSPCGQASTRFRECFAPSPSLN